MEAGAARGRVTTHGCERGLTRLWRCRPAGAAGAGLVDRVLAARGLGGDAAAFLDPSLKHLHDPSLMPDLDRAAARLLGAVEAGEPVVIYGDYDVDGVTATCILVHTLRAVHPGADIRTYVPHRVDEGYGLNAAALRQLAGAGARVVVSVDCGITAVEPAREARRAGLDLIITDHHNPPAAMDTLPAAFAVVHPRRPDSVYPFGNLCGAGVAFKLAWRIATMHCGTDRVTPHLRELLLDLLAFAALGVIADVVPLLGENRVIARYGLARIKHSKVTGLRALVEAAGLAGEHVDSDHVGFILAPRLNACGRMGHAREAVELFTTEDGERAAAIARDLTRLNNDRRATERGIVEQACEAAEKAGMTSAARRAIVLADDRWHQGVIGIACSRLIDRYHRPTILLSRRGDECHGSGRSIEGYSLHAALGRCSAHLTGFGGHDMAAGLRLGAASLDAFTEAFISDAGRHIDEDRLTPSLWIDCDAGLDELTLDAVAGLGRLAPFGQGNPKPRLRLRGVRIAAAPQPMGTGGKHLSLRIGDSTRTLRLVAWNWGERAPRLAAGVRADAVICPRVNTWNGRSSVEAEVEDLRVDTP
ncbi:MAG: single-stranded-DNA-specific exonuclease RecJ [Phycisphaerales bacterium]|nr:single-stranded-DNA-specific exonuclease RecJ [Phycisphaerales bacterium]